MRSNRVDEFFGLVNSQIYNDFNKRSAKSPKIGHLMAIPVALADVLLKLVKITAQIIESIVVAIFNLIGASCFRKAQWAKTCQIKDAIYYIEKMFRSIVYLPVAALLTPIFLIYQMVILFKYPQKANSTQERFAFNDEEATAPPLQTSFAG